MAAHGFAGDPPWAAGRGPQLLPSDVTDGKPFANHAIVDLKSEPAPQLGPRAVRISVEVANFGAEEMGHSDRKTIPGGNQKELVEWINGTPITAKYDLSREATVRQLRRWNQTSARQIASQITNPVTRERLLASIDR